MSLGADSVLVEAEQFETHGGWVLDQQFMDLMGSPFMLAHGMGTPVEDAKTTVDFQNPGKSHLFLQNDTVFIFIIKRRQLLYLLIQSFLNL